jgi:NTE family protein
MAVKKIPRIAIACQGGGSHTAFTAGVLRRILRESDKSFEIVALSGTSGGAVCALLAWYGLVKNDKKLAADLLDDFWKANSASSPWDAAINNTMVWSARLSDYLPVLNLNPYNFPSWGQAQFKALLQKYVNFAEIKQLQPTNPLLLIGAVNVLSGQFKVFRNLQESADGKSEFNDGDDGITVKAILASAAIPTMFQAMQIGNDSYWDGLFSQNPPVRDLPDASPDEIWVIRVNPLGTQHVPTSISEISDRRNELTGNLSLEQELYFIQKINDFVKKGYLATSKYKHIEVKQISFLDELDTASKLDRSPEFIHQLIQEGEAKADEFLKQQPPTVRVEPKQPSKKSNQPANISA